MARFRLQLAGWAATVFIAVTARAVVVGGSTNTSDPGTAAWNYVGSINGGAGGVFLGNYGGNGWVLTAAHVGAGSFALGGTTYTATGTAFSNFTNNSVTADLTLFQISGTPSLANLSLASLTTGNAVELIGFGGGKSWGDNTVYGFANYTLDGLPYGGPGILTLASGGGQGVGGDSGGGLFYQSSGTWYLAGILSGVGPFDDGHGNNLGQGTVSVDLAVYYSQLNADLGSLSAIPEPGSTAASTGIAALFAVVAFRRRTRGG